MDAGGFERLAELLRTHEEQLLKQWVGAVAGALKGRLTEAEIRRQLQDLYTAISNAAAAGEGLDGSGSAAAELRAVLADLSTTRARQGFSGSETAVSVFGLKDALLAAMELSGDGGGESLADFVQYAQFVDKLGLFTFEHYAQAREELISEQAEQLLELSTPVVKLWEGIVAVPLVGTLDSARSQVVMERLLEALVDTGSPYAIIDITGVPAVDTQVAQHVLKTVMAARLMGAECIISGIRPQIAQTIVTLGIEFGDIVTKATLAEALRHALRAAATDLGRATDRGLG
jgi:rsbT co-antagonist protein RsbR